MNAVSSGSTDGSSLTISHTTAGGNRLMLVGISINNDNLETVSTMTYGGTPLTREGFVDPLGAFSSDYATSSSASLSVPSASGELLLGVFACEKCNSVVFTSPVVEQWQLSEGGGNTVGAGGMDEGAASQVTLSASLGESTHWALGGISIRPGS